MTTEQKAFVQLSVFYFNRKQSDLEFETKFAQIRYELTEILQFQNWQVDRNFKILPIFGVLILTMRVHWIICHYEEIFAEYKLK